MRNLDWQIREQLKQAELLSNDVRFRAALGDSLRHTHHPFDHLKILNDRNIKELLSLKQRHAFLTDYPHQLFDSTTLNSIREIQRFSDEIRRISEIRDWLDQAGVRGMNVPNAIINVVSSMQNLALINRDGPNFLSDVLSQINSIHEASEEQDSDSFEESLKELAALITNKVKLLAASHVSFEGMLGILLGIGFFLYQLQDSAKMERRLAEQINQTELKLLKAIEPLHSSQDERKPVYFIKRRKVALKISPRTKAATIALLSPNQTVTLIQKKGKWVYVEYFDYVEALPRTGWILKKYADPLR